MSIPIVYKTPTETIVYRDADFTGKLPSTDTALAGSSVVTAKDSGGTAAPTVITNISPSALILGADLTGGVEGEDYTITFGGVGATSGKRRDIVVEMRVRAKIPRDL